MLAAAAFTWEKFLHTTANTAAGVGARYALLAGFAWLLGYVIFRRRWLHRKIVARLPRHSDVWREIAYSAVTVIIFGAVGAATYALVKAGHTQMYFKLAKHGAGWFWLSIGCVIVLHDAYFYWSHRLLHHPRVFRWSHRVHHLSHNPTQWASYSFSPLEAVVQAAIFPLAVVLIPLHPLAFGLFMLWQIVFNVLGHTGYEIYPRWFLRSWLGRILNTPTNHIMHHETMRGNYGLYFNWWDRLMGTNHPHYEARFQEVTERSRT